MFGTCLRYTLWIASALSLAGYLSFAAPRLLAPDPHDHFEAALLDHATRLAGAAAPAREASTAAPVALMPGYPFVVSGFVRTFDPKLWEPRLITLLVTLVTALLVVTIVRSETRSATLGAAGGGLLFLGQGLGQGGAGGTGPDALMLLLVLAAFLELRSERGRTGALFAALFLAAGCFTHLDGLWFTAAALVHVTLEDRKHLPAFALALAVFLGGGGAALWFGLGSWFTVHAWDAAIAALRFEPVALLRFLGTQLLGTFGVLILATVLSFALPRAPWRGSAGAWVWMGLASLGAALMATQSAAGQPQALRACVVAFAVIGPISIQRITLHLAAWPGSSRVGGQNVVFAALALQFVMILAVVAPALR